MSGQLTLNELKVHSRKQLIAWVQQTNVYKFEQVKNGLFFIKLLSILLPQQASKHKIYSKPTNDYEYTYNMTVVKRILNKHKLQINMDITQIIQAKNCFELVNWFKNLYEQNKKDDDQFTYVEKNYTPSKNNSVSQLNSPVLKNFIRPNSSDCKSRMEISRSLARNQQEKEKVNKNLLTLPKPPRNTSQKANLADKNTLTEQQKSKTMTFHQESQQNSQQSSPIKNMSHRNLFEETMEVEETEMDLPTLLKIQALKQSIQSYEGLLEKIKCYVDSSGDVSAGELSKNVIDIIYMRK